MPIVAPDNIGFTDLGGSSITPRDTYARPALTEADQTLGQLADAASKMGVKFNQLAEQQGAGQKEQEAKQWDYTYNTIRDSIKKGEPVDAQMGTLLPQALPSTRFEMARRFGAEQGKQWITDQMAPVLQDPRAMTDPNFVRNEMTRIKSLAAKNNYAGNPAYGTGYAQGIDSTADALINEADQRTAGYYKGAAETNLAGDALNGAAAASTAPGVRPYKSVGDAEAEGHDFSVLKAATTKGPESVDHLNVEYAGRLQTMIQAAQNAGIKVNIFSGYRSEAHQAELYNDKVAKLMASGQTQDQAMRNARRWVAPPGSSNHNFGEAVDLKYGSKAAQEWVHQNADKFGLYFPMGHEPWHIEMIGGRRQQGGAGRPETSDTGEPVEDQTPDQKLQSVPAGGGFLVDKIAQVESGNNPSAQNPNSSAGGVGQFIDSTWLDVARSVNPALRNASDAEVLAMKKDSSPEGVAFQKQVLTEFTNRNANDLQRNGVTPSAGAIYAAHTLGSGTAAKVFKADDNVPLKQLIGAKAMASNPQWSGMTVGEYKQWASNKMGAPVSASTAGQNAIRRVDYTYSKTMPLDTLVRRDIYGKTLLKAATETLDPSWLDKMPPEYMTPQQEFEFQTARRQINDAQDARARQQRADAEAQRQDKIRAAEKQVNDYVAQNGKPPPLSNFVGAEPEVFAHVRGLINKDYSVDPSDSVANRAKLANAFEAAAVSGDYSKINPAWTKAPGSDDMVDFVRKQSGLNSADTNALIEQLPKLRQVGNSVTNPDAKEHFDTMVKTTVDFFKDAEIADNQSLIGPDGKTMKNPLTVAPKTDWEGQARAVFQLSVKNGVKKFMAENNGQVPVDMTPIYENAVKATNDHLKLLNATRIEATKGGDAKTFAIAGMDEQTATKVLDEEAKGGLTWTLGPDGVHRLVGQFSTGTPVYNGTKPGEDNATNASSKAGANEGIVPLGSQREGASGPEFHVEREGQRSWVPLGQLTGPEREQVGAPPIQPVPADTSGPTIGLPPLPKAEDLGQVTGKEKAPGSEYFTQGPAPVKQEDMKLPVRPSMPTPKKGKKLKTLGRVITTE